MADGSIGGVPQAPFIGAGWNTDPRIRRLSCAARGTLADLVFLSIAWGTPGSLLFGGRPLCPRDICRLLHLHKTSTARHQIDEIHAEGLLGMTSEGITSVCTEFFTDSMRLEIGQHGTRKMAGHWAGDGANRTAWDPKDGGALGGDQPVDGAEQPFEPCDPPPESAESGHNDPVSPNPEPGTTDEKSRKNSDLFGDPVTPARARTHARVEDITSISKTLPFQKERTSQIPSRGTEDRGGLEGSVRGERRGKEVEIGASEAARTAPAAPARPKNQTGSRLDPSWQPSDADWQYAVDRGLDPAEVLEDFRGHWLTKAGQDARKLDWSLTWMNWVRREARGDFRRGGAARGTKPRQTDWSRRQDEQAKVIAEMRREWGLDDRSRPHQDGDDSTAPIIDGELAHER